MMGSTPSLITLDRVNYAKIKDLPPDEIAKQAKGYTFLLFPKPGVDYKVFLGSDPVVHEGEELVTRTLSVCPYCYSLVAAVLVKRDGKVYERKVCPEHGEFEELYFGDYALYESFLKWQKDGKGIRTPNVQLTALCPYNCGLCARHKSHTALLNVAVTNRCELRCWYCFFYAVKAGYVYEPSLNHIRFMLREARKMLPYPAIAVQFTGGEPLLRDDIVDIVKVAKEEGYHHVQVNTEGVRLAFEPDLALKLREAGANVIYISFDGVTPYTNPKNHWEIPYVLENLRRAKLGAVLVPTVIKNYNLHELGAIIRFGVKHADIVRGVNMQPVSIVGRVPRKEREKLRVTIPDVLIEIEKQTGGQIKRDDWYPVPTVAPISRFVEGLTGRPQFELTCHFACGAATYLFWDSVDELIPITRFVDVAGVMELLNKAADDITRGRNKYMVSLSTLVKLSKYVDTSQAPRRFRTKRKFLRYIFNILVKHDYSSLGDFHYQSLFLGLMHFMDAYNYDVSRVQRCEVHYAMPDGRIVPFCTFNVLPEMYRDRAQKFFSYTVEEWEKISGKNLSEEVYVRNIKALMSGEPYKRAYEGIADVFSIPYEEHVTASKKFGIPVVE